VTYVLKGLIWLAIAFVTFVVGGASLESLYPSGPEKSDVFLASMFFVLLVLGLLVLYRLRGWLIPALGAKAKNPRPTRVGKFKAENGFNSDVFLTGNISIMFDTKAKRMAFVYADDIVEHPFDYIREWEGRWTQRGTTTYNHQIQLRVNNLQSPIVTITPGDGFSSGSQKEADRWDATLKLVLAT
jgi:hypothetical protein